MSTLVIFLVATGVVCSAFALPQEWWRVLGEKTAGLHLRLTARAVERELLRQSRKTPFQQDKTFLPAGVGLAFDFTRGLMFVAVKEDGEMRSAILPVSAVTGCSTGETRANGFYDHYVDVAVKDDVHPLWRILCGEDLQLTADIAATVNGLHA